MPPSHPSDTIAAIATAPGEGAVAIVRLSGADTFRIADDLFRCPPPLPSRRPADTFVHGHVLAPHSLEVLDDALLLIFRAPRSYTGEDSAEFQCHGGSVTARRILDALLAAGARQAEPGEFTKRAFLNGKLDLTQAEAVLDLIHARSERAARLATAQLDDALGIRSRAIYDDLVGLAADVEAMLDFPDDELPQSVASDLLARAALSVREIQALLDTWHEGRILREGTRIVIAGRPNVGKSTLLNRLAGRERAIVSPHPGTTRDTIEESISLHGIPVHLIDTAGLRDAPCEIEQEGIRRTRLALAGADLLLYLLDASQPLSDDESSFLQSLDPAKSLVLLNKIDLGRQIDPETLHNLDFFEISLKNEPKIDDLTQKIVQKVLQTSAGNGQETFAISGRHKQALQMALEELKMGQNRLETGLEIDFLPAATHFRAAIEQIGQIFGKNCSEEVLDSIFSRFCVGK
jgi:tRNA modification GTPase